MGAQEGGGLTLEGLAQKLQTLQRENAENAERLETLEHENKRMRSENAELRKEVSTLKASGARREKLAEIGGSERRLDGDPVSVLEGRVSRKSLLSKAGAAAVAAVAAGTLLAPREAKAAVTTFDDIVRVVTHGGQSQTEMGGAGAAVVADRGRNTGFGVYATADDSVSAGVHGFNFNGDGVQGKTFTQGSSGVYGLYDGSTAGGGYGVTGHGKGQNFAGVFGQNFTGNGVWGISTNPGSSGVYGQHSGSLGNGVTGDGKGESYAGVLGRNEDGTGVWGKSPKTGYSAVFGQHTGTFGYGVIGLGTGSGAGVLGRNNSGYGGQFEGGRAQLMLKPGSSAGKPTTGTHTKGEIYMDKAGALFVCTAGDGTSVGTWKKVNMKLV